MSPRTLMVVGLSLAFGLSAAWGVRQVLSNTNPRSNLATVKVVVAAIDLNRGEMITADRVKFREIPKDYVPTGALTELKDAEERVVFMPMFKDEPVILGKISTKGAKSGLASLVPKGMRAFTIQTPNVASGVAGFIMPGNRVDVLLTVTESGPERDTTGGGSTSTLLQNVEILAVDQRIDAPAENKMDVKDLRSVTLVVTPDQAAQLDLGQNRGTLHLSLRNHEDHDEAKTKTATLRELRFKQNKPWDEKALGVIDALGKALSHRTGAADGGTAPGPGGQRPLTTIRTIRGMHESNIPVAPHHPSGPSY